MTLPEDEAPCLFREGFHNLGIEELKQRCVTDFPASHSRSLIFDHLRNFYQAFLDRGFICEMWIDGSFLTSKEEPKDVDILVLVGDSRFAQMSEVDKQWWNNLYKNKPEWEKCDYTLQIRFDNAPEGSRRYWLNLWSKSYWIRQFGFGRQRDIKGIAVLQVFEEA